VAGLAVAFNARAVFADFAVERVARRAVGDDFFTAFFFLAIVRVLSVSCLTLGIGLWALGVGARWDVGRIGSAKSPMPKPKPMVYVRSALGGSGAISEISASETIRSRRRATRASRRARTCASSCITSTSVKN